MKRLACLALPIALSALAFAPAGHAADAPAPPSPGEIVAGAPAAEWVDIPQRDLLVMTLAPAPGGSPRRVVIQLIGKPFVQPWVENIRTLARAHWYDGVAVSRVQDNYVAQWGDPEGDDAARAKPLPAGLLKTGESDYTAAVASSPALAAALSPRQPRLVRADAYAARAAFAEGWPVAADGKLQRAWPIHCYGYVGVGRGMSPDAGTGAELYTVIGHAPRHLDRNIAVVGRVIEGIEHLSSLPRGTGPLGFYEKPAERTPVLSIRLASDLPPAEQPHFQYLSTRDATFQRYADARANRRDPFFIVPAGGADVCNITVPLRRKP